jgi:uncharacterized protein
VKPWYGEGLRFTCQQCGNCCRGPDPGYVWVTEEEIAALAKRLDMSLDAFGRLYLRRVGGRYSLVERYNHDCVFWEEGQGCKVYSERPEQCRTFPFWPEFIESKDAWKTIDWCRGKDQGRVFTPDEIDELSKGDGATSGRS